MTNVDLMLNGKTQGTMANEFQTNGLNIGKLRPWVGKDGNAYMTIYNGGNPKDPKSYFTQRLNTNGATLRRDEWKKLDEAVLGVSEYRLGGLQDLVSKGLTYDLGNGLGTTVLESHDVSDAMEAELSMDGVTRGKNDRVNFKHTYLPIPIIHVDYQINARTLEASRRMGNPLDTTSAERAARKVNELLENMLFTDIDYAFGETDSDGRNKIYSYVNFPDRNVVTMGTPWDNSAKSPEDILRDVLKMKQASINAHHYGSWKLYVPTAYETILDEDYDPTTPGTTIRERILKIGGIENVTVIDSLGADNVLLVEMKKETVRLVRGLGLQNIEWKSEGQFLTNYKVLTIQVPQIRSDYDGRTGIVHLSV